MPIPICPPLPVTPTHVAALRGADIDHRVAAVGALIVGVAGLVACGSAVDPAAVVLGAGGLALAVGGDHARAALRAMGDDRTPRAYARAWYAAGWHTRTTLAPGAWADPTAPDALAQIITACVQQVARLVALRRAQRRARRR